MVQENHTFEYVHPKKWGGWRKLKSFTVYINVEDNPELWEQGLIEKGE